MDYSKNFPRKLHNLSEPELARLVEQTTDTYRQTLSGLLITELGHSALQRFYLPIAAALAKAAQNAAGCLLVGVNGAQGSGKTSLCALLTGLLEAGFGLRTVTLSIDDLYYSHAERVTLAATVHPLLLTRGVPGTHDVAMGLKLLSALKEPRAGAQIALPLFDKARDDRADPSAWRQVVTPFDIVLFEGWCVGARAQEADALLAPLNSLEADEDPQCLWRRHVNQQLSTVYNRLFATLDLLIMLEIPGMESVFAWRSLQEQKLAAQKESAASSKIMDEAALYRFIMHYERLTRHMLAEMPQRANLVFRLASSHQIESVRLNSWPVGAPLIL